MAGLPRHLAMPADEVGVYHCFNRCVQQAYLCGVDPVTQTDYSHRKVWIRDKIRQLARSFALDLLKISLMDNHLHLLLRTRPELVACWDDLEVARRWWEVCPERRDAEGAPAEPQEIELQHWLGDPDRMSQLRQRLASPSWLMGQWCAYIGRRCNRETGKHGRFFEERFRSVRLLDEAAVLACALYIDLNPIRAGKAATPEQSEFTSAFDRIQGRQQRAARAAAQGLTIPEGGGLLLDVHCADECDADSWLAPVTLDARQRLNALLGQWFDGATSIEWSDLALTDEAAPSAELAPSAVVEPGDPDPAGAPCPADGAATETANPEPTTSVAPLSSITPPVPSTSSVPANPPASAPVRELPTTAANHFPAPRASNKGFLSATFDEYLQLLDWTGRQLRDDKRGVIPSDLPPILERLGIRGESWLDLIDNFARWFHVAAGRVAQLAAEAERLGRQWLQGRPRCAQAFT